MSAKNLLCYAFGRDGDWEAICVDFDISVQGRSFDEVRSLLGRAIELYVEDASGEDDATARRLLGRTAPFGLRLRWALALLWHWLNRNRSSDRISYAGFDLSCHA